MKHQPQATLILGSGSPYRKNILTALGLRCDQLVPAVDETPATMEDPRELALRLARSKAQAVVPAVTAPPPWVVIGCDQVCHAGGKIYGKPGNRENAIVQLTAFSDQWVTFSTGLCILSDTGERRDGVEDFECRFRNLAPGDIERYVDIDQPYDCAGSIKAEAAGMTLMQTTLGRDINTLYGLPVMLLRELLESIGLNIFDFR